MRSFGSTYVDESLSKIAEQTYKNIQVVISDHSQDDKIFKVCEKWKKTLDIKYLKKDYDITNASGNFNNAIKNSDGDYIKLLCCDDFLTNGNSIQQTVDVIRSNPDAKWFASSFIHTNNPEKCIPYYSDTLITGVNTIGCQSGITIKNDDQKIYFDEKYLWLMDCDYYINYYKKYGDPIIINEPTITIRISSNQLTNIIPQAEKNNELNLIKNKYI